MGRLGRSLVLWMVVLLAGASPARAVDPSRDLEHYVLFGIDAMHLKHDAYIAGGDIGANTATTGSISRYGVSIGRKGYVATGNNIVGNQCHLGSSASVDNVFTNDLTARTTGSIAVDIRGTGPVAFAAPIVASIPALPVFAPGTTTVSVPRGETIILPPGAYGVVVVPNDSGLELTGGVYEFASLRMGKEASVLVVAASTINIQGTLRIGDGSAFGPKSAAVGPRQVKVNVGGNLVRVSASSEASMRLLAPNARIRFGRSALANGQFIGRWITSDHSPQFNHPCGNGVMDPGEECDDGNATFCDGYTPECKLERCGDGTTCPTQDEECDDGNTVACDGCSPSCHTERCGDGVACPNQGEQCDDGNATNCDGCSSCHTDTCGDGVACANEGEQCDDGNATACDGCSSCHVDSCGDGVVCGTEQCDDGNATQCDGCTACKLDTCGDGVTCRSEGEACDPPSGSTCTATCQLASTCGDGHIDAGRGEECDDGNATACDGCTACHLDTCGDGVICGTEQCDDGNATACDGCTACHFDTCGDGVVCGSEECDDGNATQCDGCSNCRSDTCGDGITCASEGEACDPPAGPASCPTCTAGCQVAPTCGDGHLDAGCGEECDDGNNTACDGCTACKVDSCGDGRVCPGEECDDGNPNSCDGCTGCKLDTCGDGVTCPNQGELCDPPAGPSGCPTCTANCQLAPTCGNGVVDAGCGEECDDGNATQCDGCTNCHADSCGDGVLCANQGEVCDDGNAATCDGCSNCQVDSCGDGIACASENEQCDDGNAIGCDGCSNCQLDACGDGVVCGTEECDDHNTDPCDGCGPTCASEFCGDGFTCANQGEMCDPPDFVTCDGLCHLLSGPFTFCTATQDEYGDPSGPANDPSTGLVTNNPAILPVTVGGGTSLTVQDQSSLICFMPTTGTPSALCTGLGGCGGAMVINACSNPPILDPDGGFTSSGGQGGGTLTGETIALRLNIELSDAGATQPGLRNFVLPTIECEGICVMVDAAPTYFPIDCNIANGTRTVGDLLVMADQALRDPTSFQPPSTITRTNLTEALHSVNTAFQGCRGTCSPSGAFLDDDDGGGLF